MKQLLVIFDCDGTLVDSQNAIFASMEHAYSTIGLPCPSRQDVLGIVGLSLPECFRVLSPALDEVTRGELARLYKDGNWGRDGRARVHDPLFPGAAELIEDLAGRGDVVLGMATGKSRRGVARLCEREGWQDTFVTVQTADDHPSKPHPSMLLTAMVETSIGPERCLMIGDTSYDMGMARNAAVQAIGVSWGYHAADQLAQSGAHCVLDSFAGLAQRIGDHLSERESGA